jgi:hypothetical protein
LIAFFTILNYNFENAPDSHPSNIISLNQNNQMKNNKLSIYGNSNEDISDKKVRDLNDGYYVLEYDLSNIDDEDTHENIAKISYKYNGVSYNRTFTTNESDIAVLTNDIENFANRFVEDYGNEIREMSLSSYLADLTPEEQIEFNLCEVESGEHEYKPYGKAVFTSNIYVSVPNMTYSVYMIDTTSEFIPGYALNELNIAGYDNWKIEEGYIRTSVIPVFHSYYGYGYYGEDPNILEYWPKNVPGTRTISTSFGLGGTIGISQKDGFNGSVTGNFGYSQSYTESDPALNASTITLGEEIGYTLTFHNGDAKEKTGHLQSGQVVEMLNGQFEGEFSLGHEIHMQLDRGFFYSNKYLDWSPSRNVRAFDIQI